MHFEVNLEDPKNDKNNPGLVSRGKSPYGEQGSSRLKTEMG